MNSFALLWANLQRRKIRTYLTLFSVLVAFLLFTILRTMAVWFVSTDASVNRLVVTSTYSLIESLPISQRLQIEAVDGVQAVTHQTWFGGNYQDPRYYFAKFPVEPRAHFDMYPELIIDPAQLDAFANTRTGAAAPVNLMQQHGWEIGDKIPIEADIYPMRDGNRLWVFDLVASYTWEGNDGNPAFLFHYDFFDEARSLDQGSVGWWTVRIDDSARAPEIASQIDMLFESSQNPTKTATQDEFSRIFAAQMGDIGLIANGILSAVFFTILLLTANTMSQALRERIPELAVLKTLGFSNARVAMLVLGESALLCVLGGILGVGLAWAATPFLIGQIPMPGLGDLAVSSWTMALGIGVAALLGVVVGAQPAWHASRLAIADALRRS